MYLTYQYRIYSIVEGVRIWKVITDCCVTWESVFLPAATADTAAYDLWPHHLVSWEAGRHALLQFSGGPATKGVGGTEPRQRETGLYNCRIVFVYQYSHFQYVWVKDMTTWETIYTPFTCQVHMRSLYIPDICAGFCLGGDKGGNSSSWK